MRRKVMAAALAAATFFGVAACGGGDSGSTGSTSSGLSSRGPITYVQGKDNSNVVRPTIAKWNKAHPDEKVTFKEQTDQADQQHDDLVQHFQAKDKNYDVVSVDVVWTAEFAAKGWLQPLEGKMAVDTNGLLPATVKSATYNGKLYASPVSSDGGLLYYRKDLVKTPPKTWDEMMADCKIAKQKKIGCYAGQFTKYEGLTVNAAEAINTDGGTIVGKDGSTPTVDSPDAAKGLTRLVDAYKDGNIPKQAITFQEEQGRQAFEAGKLLFLRNWPYVYNLAKTDSSSKVKNTFGVAPLPGVVRHRCVEPRWSQRRDQRLQRPQGDRARLPAVPDRCGVPEVRAHPGLAGSGACRPLQRPGAEEEVPVPADPADVDPERRAAPGLAVLPGGHEGDPGQRLRGVEGTEDATTGGEGHVRGHQRGVELVDVEGGSGP